jgi:hypothetical protein
MTPRGVVVFALLLGVAGCSLLVSTSGLEGAVEGAESGAEASNVGVDAATTADAADVDASAVDSGANDATGSLDGSVWSGNGHRYDALLFDRPMSWDEARMAAWEAGGHLVTITSSEEDDFVQKLVQGRSGFFIEARGPWIGAYQPTPGVGEPAGGWAWLTKEPWSYTNWNLGEPNNAGDAENYAQLYSGGGWNDTDIGGSNLVNSAVVEFE